MNKQLEALIKRAKHIIENGGLLARDTSLALIEALEQKEEQRTNWFQMAQKLGEDMDAAEKRIAELEADQQKIVSMSSFTDERLKEIERHRENSLLGNLPADLARELRQTRSRLGNYYSLLKRADGAESRVRNLTLALRANGIHVEGE